MRKATRIWWGVNRRIGRRIRKHAWKHKKKYAIAGGIAVGYGVGVRSGLSIANYSVAERRHTKKLRNDLKQIKQVINH